MLLWIAVLMTGAFFPGKTSTAVYYSTADHKRDPAAGTNEKN